jgi:plastocyanin
VRHQTVAAVVAVTMVLVSTACGGGDVVDSSSECRPTTADLHVTARNTQFNPTCLAITPDTKFRIIFENHDPGVPHTISIYTVDPSKSTDAKLLFQGDRVQGPAIVTYDVPGLPPGTHFFRCEVHPTEMFGTFIVEG